MSVNLYNKETKTLTQVAGTGGGVAKFGTPIENWLTGHSSAATAITADRDGILYYFKYNGSTETPLVAELIVNGKSIRGTRTTGWSSGITLPIRKGDVVYVQDPLSGDQSTFYPFVENIVQPIEGGEEYSTNETVIGTWIDGKPIYRKTMSIATISTDYQSPSVIATNVAELVNAHGSVVFASWGNTTRTSLPLALATSAAGGYVTTVIYNGTLGLFYSVTGASWTFKDAVITVEYTKTTD